MDNSTHQSPTPLQAAVIGRKPCQESSKGFFVPGMVGGWGGGVGVWVGGRGRGVWVFSMVVGFSSSTTQ